MATSTIPTDFLEQSQEFLTSLVTWERNLPSLSWSELQTEAQKGRVALFSLDMTHGFCHEGTLASPRMKGIIPAVLQPLREPMPLACETLCYHRIVIHLMHWSSVLIHHPARLAQARLILYLN